MANIIYADDAAICTSLADELPSVLGSFSAAYTDFGLSMSLKKIVVISQSSKSVGLRIGDTEFGKCKKV